MCCVPQVGTISANGESEIGELIAKAMERVGKEGVITVEVGLRQSITPLTTPQHDLDTLRPAPQTSAKKKITKVRFWLSHD